jgi:hypothetical protein
MMNERKENMSTFENVREWEMQCYGMLSSDIEKNILNSPMAKLMSMEMMAMSILSDAQELLERNQNNRARQHINIAKYILGQMMDRNYRKSEVA